LVSTFSKKTHIHNGSKLRRKVEEIPSTPTSTGESIPQMGQIAVTKLEEEKCKDNEII
jgi:hypothetical protein